MSGKQSDITPLPNNQEAERAVLGSVLIEGILSFARELKPDDFYDVSNGKIFKAMQTLSQKETPIDLITLSECLQSSGSLADVGGSAYIAGVFDDTPTSANLPHYVAIVKEKAIRREIIKKSMQAKEGLKDADLGAIIADMRGFYGSLALMPTLEDISFFDYQKLLEEGKTYANRGKETGLIELDRAVKIMPKELIIIGARVRHGKSSIAYNLLLNFLERHPEEAFVFFNLDVPSPIVMSRLATIHAKKHTGKIYGYKDVLPSFQTQQFDKEIVDAFLTFEKYGKERRLAIVNKPNYTVEQAIAHAERLSKEKPLGAIFIDYIELLKTDKKTDSEELRISYIVNQLRIASETLSVPVIALAQMNRSNAKEKKVEHRRPTLEGLRYSGRQEQEASTVLGLFNITAEKLEIDQEAGVFAPSGSEAVLEIIPLKNRGGESNRAIKLTFDMISGHISQRQASAWTE